MRHSAAAVLVGFADKINSAGVFNFGLMSTSGNSPVNDDLIIASPEDSKTNKTGRYVSMCWRSLNDGRRLGNQLFNFAAMLHVAQLTGRRVAMLRHHPRGWLDRWFEVPVTRVDSIDTELCPCVQVGEKAHLCLQTTTGDVVQPNRKEYTDVRLFSELEIHRGSRVRASSSSTTAHKRIGGGPPLSGSYPAIRLERTVFQPCRSSRAIWRHNASLQVEIWIHNSTATVLRAGHVSFCGRAAGT